MNLRLEPVPNEGWWRQQSEKIYCRVQWNVKCAMGANATVKWRNDLNVFNKLIYPSEIMPSQQCKWYIYGSFGTVAEWHWALHWEIIQLNINNTGNSTSNRLGNREGEINWTSTSKQKPKSSRGHIVPNEHNVWTSEWMKNGVFWVVTPCGSCKNRCFRGTWRLLHQGDKNLWTRNITSCN
jgi:hypothetical protein